MVLLNELNSVTIEFKRKKILIVLEHNSFYNEKQGPILLRLGLEVLY